MTSGEPFRDTIQTLTPLTESLPLFHTPQCSDNLRSSLPARLTNQIDDIIQGLDRDVYNNEEIEALFKALKKYSKKKANGRIKEIPESTSVKTLTNEYFKLNLNEPSTVRTLTPRTLQQQPSMPTIMTPIIKQVSFESVIDRQRSYSSPSTMEKPSRQFSVETETNKQIILMDLVDVSCDPSKRVLELF